MAKIEQGVYQVTMKIEGSKNTPRNILIGRARAAYVKLAEGVKTLRAQDPGLQLTKLRQHIVAPIFYVEMRTDLHKALKALPGVKSIYRIRHAPRRID